jgi:hypothetical protein
MSRPSRSARFDGLRLPRTSIMSRFASLVADADAPCPHTTISSVEEVLGVRTGVPMYTTRSLSVSGRA